MPLNANVLSNLIVTNLSAIYPIDKPNNVKDLADAIAQAVVTHITSSALVSTIVTIPSTSAPGSPSAGIGTGTIA